MNASVGFSIGTTVAITSGLACGMILFAILGHDLLPPLLQSGGSYTQLTPYVLTAGLVWCAIAVAVTWARRHSVLDYWLLIVALSLMSEVAFSLLGGGRGSLAAYANRIFALVTSTTILVLLLAEMTRAYAQLARSNAMLQAERNNKLMNLEAMVASISHEIKQPLGAPPRLRTSHRTDLSQHTGRGPMSALGHKQTCAVQLGGCPLRANSRHSEVSWIATIRQTKDQVLAKARPQALCIRPRVL
jgi:hypothetical protein